jgi:hypothetical protein
MNMLPRSAHGEKELKPVMEHKSGLVASEAALIKNDEGRNNLQVIIFLVHNRLRLNFDLHSGISDSTQKLVTLNAEPFYTDLT